MRTLISLDVEGEKGRFRSALVGLGVFVVVRINLTFYHILNGLRRPLSQRLPAAVA